MITKIKQPAASIPVMAVARFRVTPPIKSQLANLRPLQKVEFELRHDGNNYLITEIK